VEGILEDIEFIEHQYFSQGWKKGPPRGIMFHFDEKSGCGPGNSTHFEIHTTGIATQYVSLSNRAWHALEASDYYFSINHIISDFNNPNFSINQLEKSSEISSEIIKFSRERWGVMIPIIRAPGPGFSPGFKEHRDGIGSHWNPLLHTDGLVSVWSWQNYLDNVKLHFEEDDMAIFQNIEDFRRESLKAFVGFDVEGNPNLDSEQIVEAMKFLLGINLKMKGGDRPSKSDSLQKGWDFGEKIDSINPDAWGNELPMGKLSGTITFKPTS